MFEALFKSCVNFLLPPTPKEQNVKLLTEEALNHRITQQTLDSKGDVIALFRYRDPLIKDALWSLKYNHNKAVALLFAKVMYPYILDDISSKILFGDMAKPIVIPIPITRKRKSERGYNQSECIAEVLVNTDNGKTFSLCTDVLIKNMKTEHQARVQNKDERIKNIKDTFEIQNQEKISGKDIVLIDDIVTTGATIKEARLILLKSGARSVCAYVVAH